MNLLLRLLAPADAAIRDEPTHVYSDAPTQDRPPHDDIPADVLPQTEPAENIGAAISGVCGATESSHVDPGATSGESSVIIRIIEPSDVAPLSFAMPTSTGKISITLLFCDIL